MPEPQALPARLDRAEAVARLQGGRFLRRRRLLAAREVQVPYRLFRVTVSDRRGPQVHWLAVDAVTGQLDPYHFAAPPEAVATASDAIVLAPRLEADALQAGLVERVRREVYRRGFFRLAEPRIDTEDTGRDLHVSYWVGFYEEAGRPSIDVLSGVRRQWEGAKVRELIEAWLARDSGATGS